MDSPESQPSQTKCFWSPEEDRLLHDLVLLHGPKKWSIIARSFKNRIGKQCRERWHNHLNPEVRKDAWTTGEDKLIIELVDQIGSRWAAIAKQLPGRTDNSIKNRYYSHLKKIHEQQKDTTRTSGDLCADDSLGNEDSEPPAKFRRLSNPPSNGTISTQLLLSELVVSSYCTSVPNLPVPPSTVPSPTIQLCSDPIRHPGNFLTGTMSGRALRELLSYARCTEGNVSVPCILMSSGPSQQRDSNSVTSNGVFVPLTSDEDELDADENESSFEASSSTCTIRSLSPTCFNESALAQFDTNRKWDPDWHYVPVPSRISLDKQADVSLPIESVDEACHVDSFYADFMQSQTVST